MVTGFDINKTIEYWRKGAEYDLETSEALFEKNKYPYALFLGHLALEKLLKAIVVRDTGNHAPRTHNLPMLAGMLSEAAAEDRLEKLAGFMEFHLESRYPDEQYSITAYNLRCPREKLNNSNNVLFGCGSSPRWEFYRKCNQEFCAAELRDIKEMFQWLQKLKQ